MKDRLLIAAAIVAAQGAASLALAQGSQDLLLSEVRLAAPGDATINTTEFIEIFNPTEVPISLDNYFLTDRQDYFNLAKHFFDCEQDPDCDDPGLFATGGPTDYAFRFPQGFTIPSGGVVVVTTDIGRFIEVNFGVDADIDAYYDQPGNPQLFTTRTDTVWLQPDGTTPVPVMLRYGASEILNMTNTGEWTALVYIDGTSELVQDVDIVAWNNPSSGNTYPVKGFLTVGSSTYLEEGGDGDAQSPGALGNLLVRPESGSYRVIARVTTIEAGQAGTIGNGSTGQDETLEQAMTTWIGFTDDLQNSTPGVTTLAVGETALPPSITSTTRAPEFPSSSDTITITATVTDPANPIGSVNIVFDAGDGFESEPMENAGGSTWTGQIGPFEDLSVVRWYIQATNSLGVSAIEPFSAPGTTPLFHVQDDPIAQGDVVMNEIQYNPPGGDGGGAEFVELFNTTGRDVDLSGFSFGRRGTSPQRFTFPFGTMIEADGFLVLVQNIDGMNAVYGEGNVEPMLRWGTWQLRNGGETIYLQHANTLGLSEDTIVEVTYTVGPPWPVIVVDNGDGTFGDGTGRTFELVDPSLDETDPANWQASFAPLGTPGAPNSTSFPVQVLSAERDIEFPGSADTIAITAAIDDPNEDLLSASVFYNTGSGFASVPMASIGGGQYLGEIGPFDDFATVTWYIEAVAADSSSTLPFQAPTDLFVFHVQDTPVGKGDIVLNEISYDVVGPDSNGAEFVELYNNTGRVLDLSGFEFSRLDGNNYILPIGTTIAPNGFLVLTQNIPAMNALYGPGAIEPMLEWGNWQLLNGGTTLFLKHANAIGFSNEPFVAVAYLPDAPWPVVRTVNPDGTLGDGTGRTLELIDPSLDESLPESWAASAAPFGSPGEPNGATSVPDWSMINF